MPIGLIGSDRVAVGVNMCNLFFDHMKRERPADDLVKLFADAGITLEKDK